MSNERCGICQKVSSREIETNPGDFDKKPFVADPKDGLFFVCTECKEWHEELMLEFLQDDDPYGWKEYANDNAEEIEDT